MTGWDWKEIWADCSRRISTWRVPPRWSAGDWMEELQAQGAVAALQALADYDVTRGVPLRVHVRQRVLASVLTRSRQEWSYALRSASEISADGSRGAIGEDEYPNATTFETLHQGLAKLAPQERWLIERLFWDGYTEAKVAEKLGISQAAVNKRKCAILRKLRHRLGPLEKID
jgi:RNA polymerase sigma factor (sigma-70 family)